MSKIKCSQKKCKYNNYEHCMKDGIYVDSHASCDSYEEGPKENNTKYEFASFERKENNIICDACKCAYNENKCCCVDHLNIDSKQNNAKCSDYKDKK